MRTICAKMGRTMLAVAVLEATSVTAAVMTQMIFVESKNVSDLFFKEEKRPFFIDESTHQHDDERRQHPENGELLAQPIREARLQRGVRQRETTAFFFEKNKKNHRPLVAESKNAAGT